MTTLMDVDVGRQRRNVMVVSIALILYNALDAELGKVKLWGDGVVVSGENVLWIGIAALPYMVWRYWLYVKNDHEAISSLVHGYKIKSSLLDGCYLRLKSKFLEQHASPESGSIYNNKPTDIRAAGVFREKFETSWIGLLPHAVYSGKDKRKGDYTSQVSERLPIGSYLLGLLRCYLRVIFSNREFSDLFVPYLAAAVALIWTAVGLI